MEDSKDLWVPDPGVVDDLVHSLNENADYLTWAWGGAEKGHAVSFVEGVKSLAGHMGPEFAYCMAVDALMTKAVDRTLHLSLRIQEPIKLLRENLKGDESVGSYLEEVLDGIIDSAENYK